MWRIKAKETQSHAKCSVVIKEPCPKPDASRTGSTLYAPNQIQCGHRTGAAMLHARAAARRRKRKACMRSTPLSGKIDAQGCTLPAREARTEWNARNWSPKDKPSLGAGRQHGDKAQQVLGCYGTLNLVSWEESPLGAGRGHGDQAQQVSRKEVRALQNPPGRPG